jgi:protease I
MARIAIALANGFEDSEFQVPCDRLRAAGHEIVIVGTAQGEKIRGKHGRVTATVDVAAEGIAAAGIDALVIPGGHSPERLRRDQSIVALVRAVGKGTKLIAAICHGPLLLIAADLVRGRTLTSWPAVRPAIERAGATWLDQAVVVDGHLVTSRKPADLEQFCAAILERLPEAAHDTRARDRTRFP